MAENNSSISQADSDEVVGEFWDIHDFTEFGMVHACSLETVLYNFLTADSRPQTATLEANRGRRSNL